jgi:hypothetical protein
VYGARCVCAYVRTVPQLTELLMNWVAGMGTSIRCEACWKVRWDFFGVSICSTLIVDRDSYNQ